MAKQWQKAVGFHSLSKHIKKSAPTCIDGERVQRVVNQSFVTIYTMFTV